MQDYKIEFINFMLDSKVLQFGDFTTKSGRKTPFFINTSFYKTGKQISKLGEYYARAIMEGVKEDFTLIYGPAYKGIPLSVATSIALDKIYDKDVRYSSNRKEIKDHGDKGILLGSKILDNDKIVIVEDVITAGTSIRESIPLIKAQNSTAKVTDLVISIDRMEKGNNDISAIEEIGNTFNINVHPILTMKEVINYLVDTKNDIITDELLDRINKYYDMYGA